MNRTIEVRSDTSLGIATLLPGLPPAALWDCDVDLTLLLIGLLTSPPKFNGLSLNHYWAWLRYLVALHPKGDLRLRLLWREIDTHQKTVLSDDFGIGFPCHYLIDNHGFEDFADTAYLVKHILANFVSLLNSSKRGPSKSPDFIAVDNLGLLHIIECKGTQSSRKELMAAIARGNPQKNNLSNPGLFQSCMVGGIFVPQRRSKESAEIVFADPQPSELALRLAELGKEQVGKGVRRISLAKSFSMAGLWTAAAAIFDEKLPQQNVEFVRNLADGELRFAGYEKNDEAGAWKRTITFQSLEAHPRIANVTVPTLTTLTILLPAAVERLLSRAVNVDGSVSRNEVDAWIAEQQLANLAKRVTVETRFREPDRNGAQAQFSFMRELKSSWSRVGDADIPNKQSSPRGWRTGSGIQFLLERHSAGS